MSLYKKVLLLISIFLQLVPGCATNTPIIRDVTTSHLDNGILFFIKKPSASGLYKYDISGSISPVDTNQLNLPADIVKLYNINNYYAVITQKDGIFIISQDFKKSMNIPVNSGALPDYRINDIFQDTYDGNPRIFVTYYTPAGMGVTECKISGDFNFSCAQFNTSNSELKSNFVDQVISDMKGNIWFRYASRLSLGVSRLDAEGKWFHFNSTNSNIGNNKVLLMRSENESNGHKGDNVWFATGSGLSKLQYGQEKEEWFFFGDKQTFTDKLVDAIGIRHWFTDAIIDIVDIAILPDSIIIANKYALFYFTENNIERYLPETTGGIEELRIEHIVQSNNNIFVVIKPRREPEPLIRYLMLFQLDSKKWHNIDYWPLEKEYAADAVINPLDADTYAILFKYPSGESRLTGFSLKDLKLDVINIIE
jgi:hypothetical protein